MNVTLNYADGTSQRIEITDSDPTPRVIVDQFRNTVHQLTRTVNEYEYDEVPFWFEGHKRRFHGKGGR